MTIKAYIMVEAGIGKSREVAQALQKIKEVKSADAVTGPYDIVAVVETADMNSLGEVITKQIHQISGITRTLTCVVVKLT